MAQPGPNPQTNLIFSIVAPVVALIAIAVLYFTRPTPQAQQQPTPVNVTAAKIPDAGVVPANALPNSGTSTNSAGGSGGFGGAPSGKPKGGVGAMTMGGGGGGAPSGGGGMTPTLGNSAANSGAPAPGKKNMTGSL